MKSRCNSRFLGNLFFLWWLDICSLRHFSHCLHQAHHWWRCQIITVFPWRQADNPSSFASSMTHQTWLPCKGFQTQQSCHDWDSSACWPDWLWSCPRGWEGQLRWRGESRRRRVSVGRRSGERREEPRGEQSWTELCESVSVNITALSPLDTATPHCTVTSTPQSQQITR